MRKPYLLRVPSFDPTSGGIRVMYGLYGWLLAKGEIAYLNTIMDVPTVGIYPEIYSGNDMQASKVVRYVLQTPGIMSHYGIPGPSTEEIKATSDDVIVFSKIYDTIGVPDENILFLPILNTKIFKDQRRKRTKTCYLVGKGHNQLKHPADSIELTRQFAADQEALADLLNECTTIYVYDRLSAMMEIARLCGTKVKYYGDFTMEELKKYEPGLNGINSDLDTLEFRLHYQNLITTFEVKLDGFIERTQR